MLKLFYLIFAKQIAQTRNTSLNESIKSEHYIYHSLCTKLFYLPTHMCNARMSPQRKNKKPSHRLTCNLYFSKGSQY